MAENIFKQAIGSFKSVARHSPVLGISANAAHGGLQPGQFSLRQKP